MKATWDIEGIVFTMAPQTHERVIRKKLAVRYQSDNLGKSLSIADEESGLMLEIPFDGILKEIEKYERR